MRRMEIVIEGVANRTVSAVDDLVNELKASGVSDQVIKDRIMQEIEGGRALVELRSFATARVPGFVGDMTYRFARDTLAAKQAAIDALREQREGRQREDSPKVLEEIRGRLEDDVATADDPDEKDRAEQILAPFDKSSIDITAFEAEELPELPPDEDLNALHLWVAVKDRNTCDICAGNHGQVKTLGEWSEIGEPRSGACMGDQSCRCVLVPAAALTEKDQKSIRDNGPVNPGKVAAPPAPPAAPAGGSPPPSKPPPEPPGGGQGDGDDGSDENGNGDGNQGNEDVDSEEEKDTFEVGDEVSPGQVVVENIFVDISDVSDHAEKRMRDRKVGGGTV